MIPLDQSNQIIFTFSLKQLCQRQTEKELFHQFNLDFDREIISINGKVCKSRFVFFIHFEEETMTKDEQMKVLFCCQQTDLADFLIAIQTLLSNFIVCDDANSGGMKIDLAILSSHPPHPSSSKKMKPMITIKKRLILRHKIDPDQIIGSLQVEGIANLEDDLIVFTTQLLNN